MATMTEKGVINLFAMQKNMKPHIISKIILNKENTLLMGINKNYFYFVFTAGDIWRTDREKTIFIPR
ncbi:MAG: hypothetical protein GX493_03695 [Firmicutes bacterium]|nr:hypothetical protein [Bacillota bacterium]